MSTGIHIHSYFTTYPTGGEMSSILVKHLIHIVGSPAFLTSSAISLGSLRFQEQKTKAPVIIDSLVLYDPLLKDLVNSP